MELIRKIKALANRQDNAGMRELFNSIASAPDAHSVRFKGFGSCFDWQDLYLFYSEGEAVLVLVDDKGAQDELADEEKFNDEEPLWFTSSSHRLSPFAQVRTLMLAFKEAVCGLESPKVESCFCALVTNGYMINFYDMQEEYDKLGGVVFHDDKDIDAPFAVSPTEGPATQLLEVFQRQRSLWNYYDALFEPFEPYFLDALIDKDEPVGNAEPEDKAEGKDDDEDDDFDLLFPPGEAEAKDAPAKLVDCLGVDKLAEMPPVNILEPIADPQAFLNEMIGLKELKASVSDIVAYAKFRNKVKAEFPDASPMPASLHTIIVGNPGTGKTTMCRIYGGLLHKAGVLSRGHTVVASRSSFIGQQFGTEELRMRQCLELAQGGCLFIDEAAQLFDNPHPHDPGRGALQLLLQCLSEEGNRDIAVVMALYACDKSLDRLYALNPGIKSRFVNVLSFPDYTWPELLDIARQKAKAQSLTFTPGAWRRFCEVLRDIYDHRDKNYGNAREVVNLLQRCVVKHAVRCERQGVSGSGLLRLTTADICPPAPAAPAGKIGFGN